LSTTRHRKSVFAGAAVLSGLMTDDQFDELVRDVLRNSADPDRKPDDVDDDELASRAVELQLVSRWQAEHLKKGRTKFNLGEYLIVDELGHGGMGHVFKGEHTMLGRIEAVKVLPSEKSSPESIARFQREIRAHAQLDHPNLVRLSYAGRDGSRYYLVTEYVPGTDLRRMVRQRGVLTMYEAATIISQTAQGLEHAHACGLVHRDIKPGNLLITPEGITKVIDLGLAGFLSKEERNSDPRKGKIVGTADYLAPETIRNPSAVSPKSDIYALGCTLYYAVTGKVPFPGGTTADKLIKHLDEKPLNPKRFNPELEDSFLEVLADMMDKDPDKRVSSAGEVIRRLEGWAMERVSGVDQDNPAAWRRAGPPPLPVALDHSGPADAHFLDEDLSDMEFQGQPQSLQRTSSVSETPGELLKLNTKNEVIKLGLGLQVSPPHMLLPVLLLAATAIVTVISVGIVLFAG